jgi:hypothetical protein
VDAGARTYSPLSCAARHGTATQLCIDHLMPARRDRLVQIVMPPVISLCNVASASHHHYDGYGR